MNRREFLSAAAVGAVGAAVAKGGAEAGGEAKGEESRLATPPPGVQYFTQERLEKAAGGGLVGTEGIKYEVATYVCNLWHPTPVLEKWFGRGFSEWELVRRARPEFEGHHQPKRPLWGCHREAEVEWGEREIDLASSAGIDVFMVDWYWHEGVQFLQETLENAYMKARNWGKMKFAVMWANHDWTNFYLAPEEGEQAVLLPQTYSETGMDRMTDYLIEHYFRQANYWRIGGKPVFAIFSPDHLIGRFGVEGLRKVLDRMRERCVKAGLPGLHVQASDQYGPGRTPIEAAGFESATRYHMFAFGGKTNRTPYVEGVEFGIRMWGEHADRVKVPYFPDVPVGWDNTPRYGRNGHVFECRTPDQYERMIVAAKQFVARRKVEPPVVFLSSWNEWTEDHYLLPDEQFGYGYLEAVRRQFRG